VNILLLQYDPEVYHFDDEVAMMFLNGDALLTEVSCTVHHQALIISCKKKASMPSRIMPKSPLMMQGSKKFGVIL
jgi:hypothetical protein